MAGFRDGVEDLGQSITVNREVIDRFVGCRRKVRGEGGFREHGENGARVSSCKVLVLDSLN